MYKGLEKFTPEVAYIIDESMQKNFSISAQHVFKTVFIGVLINFLKSYKININEELYWVVVTIWFIYQMRFQNKCEITQQMPSSTNTCLTTHKNMLDQVGSALSSEKIH
jgi:hypothetical protein